MPMQPQRYGDKLYHVYSRTPSGKPRIRMWWASSGDQAKVLSLLFHEAEDVERISLISSGSQATTARHHRRGRVKRAQRELWDREDAA